MNSLVLSSDLRDWVLLPIMFIMVLIEAFRHYLFLYMAGTAKSSLKSIKEEQALARIRALRTFHMLLPRSSVEARKSYYIKEISKDSFLKNPNASANSAGAANPLLADPSNMDAMTEMMKKNVLNIVPQTLIMGWIHSYFSGFVLIRLPFPLPLRFKAMLQRGIDSPDLDIRWVSSLSWYFLNLFGLKNVFTWFLGDDFTNSVMSNPMVQQQQAIQPQVDAKKIFIGEKESLELMQHYYSASEERKHLCSSVQ